MRRFFKCSQTPFVIFKSACCYKMSDTSREIGCTILFRVHCVQVAAIVDVDELVMEYFSRASTLHDNRNAKEHKIITILISVLCAFGKPWFVEIFNSKWKYANCHTFVMLIYSVLFITHFSISCQPSSDKMDTNRACLTKPASELNRILHSIRIVVHLEAHFYLNLNFNFCICQTERNFQTPLDLFDICLGRCLIRSWCSIERKMEWYVRSATNAIVFYPESRSFRFSFEIMFRVFDSSKALCHFQAHFTSYSRRFFVILFYFRFVSPNECASSI